MVAIVTPRLWVQHMNTEVDRYAKNDIEPIQYYSWTHKTWF